MAQVGYGRWSESQKSLLVTTALASALSLTIMIAFVFDYSHEFRSKSLLQGKGSRAHLDSMKQRLEWAKEAAMSTGLQSATALSSKSARYVVTR